MPYFQPFGTWIYWKADRCIRDRLTLHNFLVQVTVPHATFFGILVSYGELAIGIGTILGLLFRPAAFYS